MNFPRLDFKPGQEKRLAQGYLWAFRNEVDFHQKDYAPGSLVGLHSSKGRPMGLGHMNSQASLCFRMLALPHEARGITNDEQANALLRQRIVDACAFRAHVKEGEACRLINSEGDGISGLIVDRFAGVLVMQISALYLHQRRDMILDALKEVAKCKAIVERSEGSNRLKEGLEPLSEVAWSAPSFKKESLESFKFKEAGLTFEADLLEGQKTGFYLDQRQTRAYLREVSEGKVCLDVFSHSGGLGLNMAQAGASSVLCLDSSTEALALAARNAKSNELKIKTLQADAFQWLRQEAIKGAAYDLICLDPPAMAKSREESFDALRGYREINLRALKMLKPGGLLVSCSCTQVVSEDDFFKTVQGAASDAQARIQEIERLGQPWDHPRHPAMDETRYLKVGVFRKI